MCFQNCNNIYTKCLDNSIHILKNAKKKQERNCGICYHISHEFIRHKFKCIGPFN